MKMSKPILILAILTVAAVLFMFWRDHSTEEDVTPTSARRSAPAASNGSAPVTLEQGEEIVTPASTSSPLADAASRPVAEKNNLFSAQSWAPPPPPPPPPPTPEEAAEQIKKNPPQAPPLPFVVIAIWRESGVQYIGLSANGQGLIVCERCTVPGSVHPGGQLLQNYRLDKIDSRKLQFTFLPLKQKQELPIGEMP